RVWSHTKFHDAYRSLLRRSIQEYVRTETLRDDVDEDLLSRLLQSATHLAGVEDPEKKEAALRIAASAWGIFRNQYGLGLRELLYLVLGRLGNFPGVRYLYQGISTPPGSLLGKPVWFEVVSRQLGNDVAVTSALPLTLTDFQRRLWDVLAT